MNNARNVTEFKPRVYCKSGLAESFYWLCCDCSTNIVFLNYILQRMANFFLDGVYILETEKSKEENSSFWLKENCRGCYKCFYFLNCTYRNASVSWRADFDNVN